MRWMDKREPMNTVMLYTFMVMGAFCLILAAYLGVVSFLAYLEGK